MQIGVVFPQTEIGADVGGVRAYAQAAEDLGYGHLLAYDHVLGADPEHYKPWAGPYTIDSMFHEVFVLYGFIAGVAPKLELVTGVIIAPQRQTALIAKQAAEVDVLTGGRFRLGLGIGWNYVEYDALGETFKNRASRFEDQIALLRELFAKPSVQHESAHHHVVAAGINPLPTRREIPIWIGGSAEPALRRAARLADGYFPQQPLAGGWAATLDRMRSWVTEAGRDWARFGIEARVNVAQGTPDDWRRAAEEWRALGATHLCVNTMGGGLQGARAHIERIRQARETLLA